MSRLLASENIPDGEDVHIRDLQERLRAKIPKQYTEGHMRRDAHPKMHGLVRAHFIVEADLPPELRIGIFRESRTYKAWIRFSNQNGTMQPDIKRDIRGMAIKLLDVPGKKLLDGEQDSPTHDFILISTPVFVTADVKEFAGLIKAMTTNVFAIGWYFLTHLRVGLNLLRSMLKFSNPLQISYFSATPYLFGAKAVKYAVTPQAGHTDALPQTPQDDYLRMAMLHQLTERSASFDFSIQIQTDAEKMPVEDPGVLWSTSLSPFIKIATIHIPRQVFDNEHQRNFGENLSFSPWHALPEHRPLGGINRARRIVYSAISAFRHHSNSQQQEEPNDWEIPGGISADDALR
ncbi:MAG TPA: catalase family protein [Rhodocyclaceae bacterium]|nr:catalase family protein [Rhodocyclaceae bacterium]